MTDFQEVYDLYFREVYRYALSLCRNESIAEEITQERLAYSYAKATNPDVRAALENGLVTEKELLNRARQGVAEAGARQKRAESAQTSTTVACCANCHWFLTCSKFGVPYFCAKHDIEFSHDDISSGVHERSRCDKYSKKGYW